MLIFNNVSNVSIVMAMIVPVCGEEVRASLRYIFIDYLCLYSCNEGLIVWFLNKTVWVRTLSMVQRIL